MAVGDVFHKKKLPGRKKRHDLKLNEPFRQNFNLELIYMWQYCVKISLVLK